MTKCRDCKGAHAHATCANYCDFDGSCSAGEVLPNAVAEAIRQRQRAEKAEAEVERLRTLCLDRPKPYLEDVAGDEDLEWIRKIDAAGRGE